MIPDLPKPIATNIQEFSGRTWLLPAITKWFEQTDDRMFILTGEPGSGKSMLLAWLAGMGPSPANLTEGSQLEYIRSQVKAVHFCLADSGNTAPKALAQNMAEQLTRNVIGFGDALIASLSDRVHIIAELHVNTVQAGGSLTGIRIDNLDLGELGDELSFDRVLREPLKQLYPPNGHNEPMLLLIDALDESMAYTGNTNIVQLLAKLTDMPGNIRFLVTTRPSPAVLYLHHTVKTVDLIKDIPAGNDDVRDYTDKQLRDKPFEGLDDEHRKALAERISNATDGNFLYAYFLLNDLSQHPSTIPHLETHPLPQKISGLYHDFLNREIGSNRQLRWFNTLRPVLALIAVAQGNGLSRTQIESITKQDIEAALEASKTFLDGDLSEGPFRVFHRSFAEFLLEDKENTAYHIDAVRVHRQIVEHYWTLSNEGTSWHKWDDYGLQYIATHLSKVAQLSDQPERHQQIERLVKLVVNQDFQETHQQHVNDLASLQRDLDQALREASVDNDPQAIPLVVENALALVTFRSEQLKPEPLFDLATRGEVKAATRGLNLFDLDLEWRQAVQLIIAWHASSRNPDEACELRDRIKPNLPTSGPLPPLLERLNAVLDGTPSIPSYLPPPRPPELIRDLIVRLGGIGVHRSLYLPQNLQTGEIISETGYLSGQDGPLLVAYAFAYPQEGEQYFREYLATHMAYNYVQYRNNSLWALLPSVLRHPDQHWVLTMLTEIAKIALARSIAEFQWDLPFALLALRVRVEEPDILQSLEKWRAYTQHAASQLKDGPGQGDSWGIYKRGLAALAQSFALVLHRNVDAVDLLELALHLPFGFAGYQSPACLTMAEAIRICFPDDIEKISRALKAAQEAAHNVRDSVFCVRSTARFNAMAKRWWQLPLAPFDVTVIQRFCEDPGAFEFAALHIVGEAYQFRDQRPDLQALPDEVLHANTLEAFAHVYNYPVADFQRLNLEQGWTKDQTLDFGTWVNVPIPEFAPMLAARLSAEVLVEPSLSPQKRVELIQSLVPLVTSNPTVLDTVLARLVLVAHPSDTSMLDILAQIAERGKVKNAFELTVTAP